MTQTRPEPKVIIIPAKEETLQDQKKKKNLRVAAYCRVSTKKDEQLNSYENQRDYYTEKIMANPNWTMADIFADEGITGTSACKRKDFLRMIRQCRKGKIDMILAKSVSRFARNTVDTLSYTRELRSMGGHLRGAEHQFYLSGKRIPHHHPRCLRTVRKRRDILPRQMGQASGDADGKGKHPV